MNYLTLLGPGLLWAGAAIGVSHLVQSTRAGAEFGFTLIWALIFANLIKYPFFEFAPRYVSATGQHLIHGYNVVGKWAVALYGIFTILTMFTIQGAVTIVTASLIAYIFDLDYSLFQISTALLLITTAIISIGRYSILDALMKFIILSLSVATLIALFSSFDLQKVSFGDFEIGNPSHLAFLIAFVGWMPAPIDIAVWHSFWSHAKEVESGKRVGMREALFDFNVGFIGTAFLAVGFLSLGAFVMFDSGEVFSPKGTVFAGQLIELYTNSIGSWAFYVIATASITTMFSTTLMCLDAYSRVLEPTAKILFGISLKWFWLLILLFGTVLLLGYFVKSMAFLVDVATTLSFVTAPILAYINYKAIQTVPTEFQPPKWLDIYAKISLIFLIFFSLGFLYWRFL